jgi:NTE family protein
MKTSGQLLAGFVRKCGAMCVALLLVGCISQQDAPFRLRPGDVNVALQPGGTTKIKPPYSLEYLRDDTSADYLVILSFSGGGKRSAAFGYGALQAAHEIMMPTGKPLSAEIDVVSGVSGGSFTASAFALNREHLFHEAENGRTDYLDFLESDLWSEIAGIYLLPWKWQWMFYSDVGTNDEMELTYDHYLLKENRFSALAQAGRPYLIVQATDLDARQPFTFTQTDFDLICSDISDTYISRAVAASNGFPVLFSPIGIQMYSRPRADAPNTLVSNCPDLAWRAREYPRYSSKWIMAKQAESYDIPADAALRNPKARFYVHLADGGLADNLSLRGPLALWRRIDAELGDADLTNCTMAPASAPGETPPPPSDSCDIVRNLRLREIKHILVVSVDGQSEPDRSEQINLPIAGGIARALGNVTNAVIDSSNLDTLPTARDATNNLARSIARMKCEAETHSVDGCKDAAQIERYKPTATFSHVALGDWARVDPLTRNKIANTGTSLGLSAQQARDLIAAGRDQMLCDPDVQDFLKATGGKVATPSTTCPVSP